MKPRFAFILIPIFAAALFAFGVHADAAEKLVIISPHWEGIRTEFARGFNEWRKKSGKSEVEITWLDQGGTSDDLRYIRSGFERTPGGIGVDLFYGGGLDPYTELTGAGLLAKFEIPDKVLTRIPKELNGVPLYDANHHWCGAALSGFGILYNKKLIKMYGLKTPRGWEDLADPALFGLVGSGDPRHSGSVHMMYEIILQALGWDRGWTILMEMGANVRNFPKSSSQTNKDLAVGEIAVGLSIDTYAFTAIEETGEDRLGFVMPKKASVITPDPIALLKGAPNPAAAQDFILFVLSNEGQKIWLYKKGTPGGPKEFSLNKMAIVPDIYRDKNLRKKTNVSVNPFDMKGGFRYDAVKGAARWNLLNDMVGAFIIDTHDDLTAAWKKLSKSKNKKKIAAIFKAPISEPAAMKLVSTKWIDEVFRNETINSWIASARKRRHGI
jgi:ABC-type Fe3+ transport system substrate-binding protein